MTKTRIHYLLSCYVSDKIQESEWKELQGLVNATDDAALSCILGQIWNETEYKRDDELYKHELDQILSGVRKTTRKQHLKLILNRSLQIAAIFLIPLLLGISIYLYQDRRHISHLAALNEVVVDVAKGQKAMITLPDGSTAFLNSESSLRYQQNYGFKDRKVNLQGEAFFNVSKDSTKAFTVFTEYLDVEVLGTSFNVYAYETEKVVEMTLVSGHVKVETHTIPSKTIFVNPNEKVLFDKTSGKLHVEKTNTRFDTAWMRGELVFRSEPIGNVLSKIERRYGVKIYLEDISFSDDRFTGFFDSDHISDVMKNLQMLYNFNYKIKGEEVWISP